MSAKTFRNKYAIPLITKLKEVIGKLIVNVVEIKKMWKISLKETNYYKNQCNNLRRANEELQHDSKSFHIIRKAIGTKETDNILRRAEEERIAKERAEQEAREREREARHLARLQSRVKKKYHDNREDR